MPGSRVCARCGGSLALASATIDVNPPRAVKWQQTLPKFYGLRRAWGRATTSFHGPVASMLSRADDTRLDLGTILRTIVPGWAHAYRGKPERGGLFLTAYLTLMVPALF